MIKFYIIHFQGRDILVRLSETLNHYVIILLCKHMKINRKVKKLKYLDGQRKILCLRIFLLTTIN